MENFDNSSIRRQDRLLEEKETLQLLQNGEYGFLALTDDRSAYGIPISFVYDNKSSIYFHCAPDGKKLNCIKTNPSACFCVVGKTDVKPALFTTAYESILVFGDVTLLTDDEERENALLLLVDKYSPKYKETGAQYIKGSFGRTAVLKLSIEKISGKSKKIPLSK